MQSNDLSRWAHSHDFAGTVDANERNTRRVLILTFCMMLLEIFGGAMLHSMALLADGWHMGTHVAAFAITAIAYFLSRKLANDPRFTFGAGKIGVLGAFTSAIILGGVAVTMASESAGRLINPAEISFTEAIPIACLGLLVNVASALMLKHDHGPGGHNHHHHHVHEGGHHHAHGGADQHNDLNLRAAYVHVIADAVTSLLAITALTLGKFLGLNWLDPLIGIVGSLVIAQWAYALIRDTVPILLNRPAASDLSSEIRKAIGAIDQTEIADLHIWQLSSGKFAAIVSLVASDPRPPCYYKELFSMHEELVHVTVEVNHWEEETAHQAVPV